MNEKIKELQELCSSLHLDLTVKYYGNYEICFKGINDNDDEIFNVAVWYPDNRSRRFYIEIDSAHEQWRGGQFSKDEILLLLSVDDLTDEELGIKPRTTKEAHE